MRQVGIGSPVGCGTGTYPVGCQAWLLQLRSCSRRLKGRRRPCSFFPWDDAYLKVNKLIEFESALINQLKAVAHYIQE